MLLAVDIGNTSTKFGLFDGDELTSKFSIPTKRDATADEIKLELGDRLSRSIDFAIVCSVVPQLEPAIRSLLNSAAPVFVDNSFDFGFKINYEPLDSLGTDRLVNAFAAVEKYGGPVIVCSLGTATTIDVVNDTRDFVGGVIAPGLDAMAEALHSRAPRLPKVEVREPDKLIGNSTMESIRSGMYFGYAAMVTGLIEQIRDQFENARIIATGGNAGVIAEVLDDAVFDKNLTLEGLKFLFKNLEKG